MWGRFGPDSPSFGKSGLVGAKNPNWHGGISRSTKYDPTFNNKLRRHILWHFSRRPYSIHTRT